MSRAMETAAQSSKEIGTDEVKNSQQIANDLQEMNIKIESQAMKIGQMEDKLKALEKGKLDLETELQTMKEGERGILEGSSGTMNDTLFDQGYENFVEVSSLQWEENIFKATAVGIGSPLSADEGKDLLVLDELCDGKRVNEWIWKVITERYPEFKNITEEVGAIAIHTKRIGHTGEETMREKWVIKATANDTYRKWYGTLCEVKEILIGGGRSELVLYPPAGDPGALTTRKMVEHIFRRTNIKYHIHIKKNSKVEQ